MTTTTIAPVSWPYAEFTYYSRPYRVGWQIQYDGQTFNGGLYGSKDEAQASSAQWLADKGLTKPMPYFDVTAANGRDFRFVLLTDGRSVNVPFAGWTQTQPKNGFTYVSNGGQPTIEVYDRTVNDWNKDTVCGWTRDGAEGGPLTYKDGDYVTGGWLAETLPGGVQMVPSVMVPRFASWWEGSVIDADTMTKVRAWLDEMA